MEPKSIYVFSVKEFSDLMPITVANMNKVHSNSVNTFDTSVLYFSDMRSACDVIFA